MTAPVKYSTILQEFIEPLLTKDDSDELVLKKLKIAEIIWNYCIAKEFKLPVYAELHRITAEQNKKSREMKLLFDAFVKSKRTAFKRYKNFIVKVESRANAGGTNTVYVESVEPETFKKMYSVFVEQENNLASIKAQGI